MHLSRGLGVIEVLLLVAGIGQLLGPSAGITAVCVLAWIVLATAYVVGSLLIARRHGARPHLQPSPRTVRRLPSWVHSLSDLTPMLAAATGLAAALKFLGAAAADASGDSLLSGLIYLLAVLDESQALTVVIGVLGWLVLHIGYAQLYQRLDALSRGRAFFFPATKQATSVEYLYLGFTIGATFATSDVEVCLRPARWAVMSHTVVAFGYNAVAIGVIVRLLTGS